MLQARRRGGRCASTCPACLARQSQPPSGLCGRRCGLGRACRPARGRLLTSGVPRRAGRDEEVWACVFWDWHLSAPPCASCVRVCVRILQVLAPLGADITGSRYLDPDGSFPNHPANPEHPSAMASGAQVRGALGRRAPLDEGPASAGPVNGALVGHQSVLARARRACARAVRGALLGAAAEAIGTAQGRWVWRRAQERRSAACAALLAAAQAVLQAGADLGVVFDTDVDRSAIVDRHGREINSNRFIALMVRRPPTPPPPPTPPTPCNAFANAHVSGGSRNRHPLTRAATCWCFAGAVHGAAGESCSRPCGRRLRCAAACGGRSRRAAGGRCGVRQPAAARGCLALGDGACWCRRPSCFASSRAPRW